jgi:hypothetical protein
MQCFPLRWIAWKLLDLIRANRASGKPATDHCSELLRELLRQKLGPNESGVILGQLGESQSLPPGLEHLAEPAHTPGHCHGFHGVPSACNWPGALA